MKDFNSIFKEKLFNYQVTPPTEVFDNIKSNYPKKITNNVSKIALFSATSIALITALIIVFYPKSEELTCINNPENILSENIEYSDCQEQNNDIIIPFPTTINDKSSSCSGEIISSTVRQNPVTDKNLQNTDSDIHETIITIIDKPQIILSDENLCFNQKTVATIVNPQDYKLELNADNVTIKNISKNKYEISNLKTGKNILKLIYNVDNQILTEEKQITVSEKPNYSIYKKSAVCSGANASIQIKATNFNVEYYILDNEIINKTGKFNNLSGGIHTITIKDINNCEIIDTIFIYDSLKLKTFFKIENDLINPNKYFFDNFTEIDFKGYEKNRDISFSWLINNKEIATSDNLTYEFKTAGNYNVKLIAKIGNSCIREYSENFVISNYSLIIPNVFTPNGDGIGDYFEISYKEPLLKFKIVISGNKGEKVFETNDINNWWDGKIYGNNDAPEGVYFYTISAEDIHGNKIDKSGTVQLLRR